MEASLSYFSGEMVDMAFDLVVYLVKSFFFSAIVLGSEVICSHVILHLDN